MRFIGKESVFEAPQDARTRPRDGVLERPRDDSGRVLERPIRARTIYK